MWVSGRETWAGWGVGSQKLEVGEFVNRVAKRNFPVKLSPPSPYPPQPSPEHLQVPWDDHIPHSQLHTIPE